MKKRSILKFVALMMALVLAIGALTGCGTATDKDEQGRTIISVGNWPSKEGTELDKSLERKERFEADNPDVSIIGDNWVFDRKTFYAKAAGGQLPILYNTGFTEIPEIINSGYSADLTDALKKHGYEGVFNESITKLLSDDNGRIMSFPNACYLLGLVYNVDLLEAAGLMEEDGTPKQPEDWDEVVEFAVKIKNATGKPGFLLPTSGGAGGWIFTSIAWSFGVDFMEKDESGKWQATFNTPEATEALQWVKDLKWKYDVIPANTIVDNTEMFKVFSTGGAGMIVTGGDFAKRLPAYGMQPNQAGIMAIPKGPKGHYALLGGGVWQVANNATEDQVDAAVRWLKIIYNHTLSDEYRKTISDKIKVKLEQNQIVGIKEMSIWSEKAEAKVFENEMIDANTNINMNHVRLYNEFVADCPAQVRSEEPVCCQELYQILDSCIQEVLSNKDADCAKIMEKANSDFQMNYLNNLIY